MSDAWDKYDRGVRVSGKGIGAKDLDSRVVSMNWYVIK
jgi:hypothetical protein